MLSDGESEFYLVFSLSVTWCLSGGDLSGSPLVVSLNVSPLVVSLSVTGE